MIPHAAKEKCLPEAQYEWDYTHVSSFMRLRRRVDEHRTSRRAFGVAYLATCRHVKIVWLDRHFMVMHCIERFICIIGLLDCGFSS